MNFNKKSYRVSFFNSKICVLLLSDTYVHYIFSQICIDELVGKCERTLKMLTTRGKMMSLLLDSLHIIVPNLLLVNAING